jgi:hypothetical protein
MFRRISILLVLVILAALLIARPVYAQATAPAQPPSIDLTEDFLAGLLGMILSAFFAYFPGVRVAFGGLKPGTKSLIMIVAMLILVAVLAVLGCNGLIVIAGFTCAQSGFIQLGFMFLVMLGSNQSFHRLIDQWEAADVTAAKSARDAAAPTPPPAVS